VLISTTNADGSYNLAPMSSAFWLGWRCMLELASVSKTAENMKRSGECVLNLPSVDIVAAVDRLARTTGSNPVPEGKVRRGYRFEHDKFGIAGLTPVESDTVWPPRVQECHVQLEATVEAVRDVAEDDPVLKGRVNCFEVRIQRVHVEQSILAAGEPNRIDPDKMAAADHELPKTLRTRPAGARIDSRANSRSDVSQSRCRPRSADRRTGPMRVIYRTNSRKAPSSPSSDSGNIRSENTRCTSLIDCV
ncbi:MAG: hypothetical protein QOC72_1512, partial [Methylobacteriaceae bacterium]|nr:hypothetical protein [Methylobacteriaceae bacterium]